MVSGQACEKFSPRRKVSSRERFGYRHLDKEIIKGVYAVRAL